MSTIDTELKALEVAGQTAAASALRSLEARISALEATADTAITKAGTFIATHAPTVLKYAAIIGGSVAAVKFDVLGHIAKAVL